MSSPTPVTVPAPTSPPTNSTSPPPSAASPPPSAAPPPPSTPSQAPPPAAPTPPSTAPPPSTPPPPTTPAPSTTPTPPAETPPPAASASPPPPPTPSTPSPPSSTPSPPSSSSPPPPARGNSPPSTPSPPSTTPSPPSSSSPSPPARGNSPPVPSGRSPLSPPRPSNEGSSGISTGLVVGIAIGGVLILVVLSFFFIFCKKKKRRTAHEPAEYYVPPPPPPPEGIKADTHGRPMQHWQQNAPPPADHFVTIPPKPSPPLPPQHPPYMGSSGASSNYSGSEATLPPPSPGMSLGFSKSSTFTYEELVRATDGFSNANLLGQGGFGYVHKGLLPNGKEVAVKQLKAGSGQGEREFQAEVEIISRVHHKHLVSLVGYCITGSQRLLVYEFVPNNTLEFHLHGKGRPSLDWPLRLKIALGSAKGLAYLHEDCQPKIIHRDIKAANILVDFHFEAKVADFGLAKLTSDLNTHVSTRVMGTFGYMAPEYASSGKLTEKSDVFSYGVMLLELITGRRPVDSSQSYMDDSLVDWARPLLTRALDDDKFDDALVDQRLENKFNRNEMTRMVACAAACVRHSAKRRPRMSQVVRALEGDVSLSDLNEGIKPGHSTVYSSYASSDYDTLQYNEDMKKFRKMALATSEEYGSSDQYSSNPTSEYRLNPFGSSGEGQKTREMEMNRMKKDTKSFNESS